MVHAHKSVLVTDSGANCNAQKRNKDLPRGVASCCGLVAEILLARNHFVRCHSTNPEISSVTTEH